MLKNFQKLWILFFLAGSEIFYLFEILNFFISFKKNQKLSFYLKNFLMSRSTKKGPFVADHLLKKIEKFNAQGQKKY